MSSGSSNTAEAHGGGEHVTLALLVRTERDAARAADHALDRVRDDARTSATLAGIRADHERHIALLDELAPPPTSGFERVRTGIHVDAGRFANATDTRAVLKLVKANLDLLVLRYRSAMQALAGDALELVRACCNDCLRHRAFIAASVATSAATELRSRSAPRTSLRPAETPPPRASHP